MTETLAFKPDANKAQYFDLKSNGETSFSFERQGYITEGAHCWDRGAWKAGKLRLTNSIITDYYTGTTLDFKKSQFQFLPLVNLKCSLK